MVSSFCFLCRVCVRVRMHASVSLKGHGSMLVVLVRVHQVPDEKVLVRILTRAIQEAPVTLLGSVFAMRVKVRVHVKGRLHSLNSTVIDMGVRHCPVNEITSLIQSVHQKKKKPPLLQFTWTACFPSTTLHVSGLARVFVHRQNQKKGEKENTTEKILGQ